MKREQIANFLRNIPQSNENARSLTALIGDDNTGVYEGIAFWLMLWGCVIYNTQHKTIQASSQTAKYTLNSLASYLDNDHTIITDWQTRGVNHDFDAVLNNGATFLWALEQQRLNHNPNATPSRDEYVAQILITRLNNDHLEFLMQYDKNARQYQFIGGRAKPTDATILETATREIAEELQPTLYYNVDYQLESIVHDMQLTPTLSPTFGALTSYTFTIYHMRDLRKNIILSDLDRWVPFEQIQHGRIETQQGILHFHNNTLYQMIDTYIKGGMQALPSSF